MNPDRLPYWKELRDRGTTDWDSLFNGYRACVDFPGYPFYREMMEQYPEAGIILTVRDFDSWYESAYRTIWQAGPQTPWEKVSMSVKMVTNGRVRKAVKCIKFFHEIFWEKTFNGRFEDKEVAREAYEAHIDSVKQNVPDDRLLVYDVKDGWEPLCDFLNVPVPDQEYPYLNKKEDFNAMLRRLIQGEMA